MRQATILTISVACVSLAVLAACTKEEAKPVSKPAAQAPAPAPQPVAAAPAPVSAAPTAQPAAPPTPAAAPQAPVAAPTPVLASGEFSNDPQLRCDLLEVKRVSGGALTVRWRLVNTAGQSQGLAASDAKKIHYPHSWVFYYTDPAENKKYGFLKDSQGNGLLAVYEGGFDPGMQRVNWAKFPAPPATSKKISINIQGFPPFEDIPVAE